jgi:PAS domain S-box-containing protein
MKSAKKPLNEKQRLEDLRALKILDTLPEDQFDQITFLASQICGTPIALISLIDENRQWFKAKHGLAASETPRDFAFCAHAILDDQVFVVPDSSQDERFFDNPLATGAPHVRFYAGATIISPSGHNIGTVCVIDSKPRNLEPEKVEALKALSKQVTKLLALRTQVELIKESEDKLKFILDGIPHMIGLWDINQTNIHANAVYAKYFNRDPETIEGLHMRDLFGEELYLKNEPHIKKVLAGEKVTFERTLSQKDGSVHTNQVSYIPNFSDGKTVSFLAIAIDITEIKNLERDQRVLETKLAESEKLSALGEMSAGVAHEVNNPLAIIKGKVAMLIRKASDQNFDWTSGIKDLKTIDTTADRIAKIVKALRTYSRDAEIDPFDTTRVLEVIEDTFELCKERFRNANIDVQVQVDPSFSIRCRPAQISQVFMNLLSNSYDALADLETKWIKIVANQSHGRIQLKFIDSGGGIPDSIVEKMMNPFFTTKEVGKGTGLGLSISTGIIKSHGGVLGYDKSASNTTFTIDLPDVQNFKKPQAA